MPDSLSSDGFSVTTGALPASRKIHVAGTLFPDLRVAMREIDLTASANEPPFRVYDTSGPYTDPLVTTDIRRGLAAIRTPWIAARGDTAAVAARDVRPEDNGLTAGEVSPVPLFDRGGRPVLAGKPGQAVTQLAYARAGIVTPEMEYVAIRENLGRARLAEQARRDGQPLGAALPDYVTPEFVRD